MIEAEGDIVELKGTLTVKRGLAQMLKGGVIMDVVTPEQAVTAQEAGAVAVMALERIPADIRAMGGVARMSSLELVQSIMDAVTIPVMAKCRIGHFAEAQALQDLVSITSTNPKCSPRLMINSTARKTSTRRRSCAARAISVRRYAGSRKARR